MKKLKTYRSGWIVLTLACFMLLYSNLAQTQCRYFAKRKCLPTLQQDGFAFSGQLNNVTLLEGDKVDIVLTFQKGKTYRLMVCFQPILGDVTFNLLDKNGSIVFNSEEADTNIFDFNVESTQQFTLEITVPSAETTHGILHEGCVSVLQGYK
ncbi:MAG: hypothetical protein HOH13_06955 [Crocinitomicaceae bacterium]|jgi:hypothetical protein|nr:hypothetical protein [Crocinitomicaceae bacterium]MBT5404285.1 hypothetical protein [Crocinitomicaceae bacterium]MBT6030027.1 hypothetical protein [Crocinitomicaceae bacterium]MBT6515862.1 hypothetical protein [Crocinitomicaceae bacterium]